MLMVFVIGSIEPKLLGIAKRVKEYRPSDYGLIYDYLSLFGEVVLLPNIISEASNLLDHLKGGAASDTSPLFSPWSSQSIWRSVLPMPPCFAHWKPIRIC